MKPSVDGSVLPPGSPPSAPTGAAAGAGGSAPLARQIPLLVELGLL